MDVWYLAIITISLVLAAGLSRVSFYRDSLHSGGRFGCIDGLRGYLALSVFATHIFTIQEWRMTGQWNYPGSAVYRLASSAPVSLFFMITAFLFWGKVVRSKDQVDWRQLFRSRFFRLAPLYLACLPFLFLLIAFQTGWKIQTSPAPLLVSVIRWLGLGVLGAAPMNGMEDTHALLGSVWTLRYEWLFYLTLPLTGLLWRIRPAIGLGAGVIALSIYFGKPVAINFVLGAAAVYLQGHPRLDFMKTRAMSVAALGLMVLMLYFDLFEYGLLHSLMLFAIFLAVCNGNSIFGALSNAPAIILGTISYSIYLIHMLVVHGVMILLPSQNDWILVPVTTALIVLLSAVTYRWIENPFIEEGHSSRLTLPRKVTA